MRNIQNENDIIAIGIYNGHSVKYNYDVELKLIFTEDHINEALQFLAGLTCYMKIICKKMNEKINIGTWSLNKLTINKNAQTKISLKSTTENADLEGIQKLISSIGEEERELIFKIRFIK